MDRGFSASQNNSAVGIYRVFACRGNHLSATRVQFRMRVAGMTLWFLLTVSTLLSQNPQASNRVAGTISGQVILEPGGTPLRKVTVSLVSTSDGVFLLSGRRQQNARSTTTDTEGHFRLEAVPAGNYRVTVQRNGFLSAGRMSQQDSSTTVTVKAGQQVDGLLFRMQPAGVITGKIVDEDGDPLPGINVLATKASGRAVYGNSATNDLGEYRIAGLKAGRYFLLAQGAEAIPQESGAGSTKVYVPTFFPGTTELSQAATVEVHPGDEVEAKFGVTATRTFSVRGQVSGLPAASARGAQGPAGGMVFLQRADLPWTPPVSSQMLPDGSFDIPGVLPGSYRASVTVAIGDGWNLAPGADTVEVKSSDVDGVRLSSAPAGEIRGRFRLDTGEQFNWAQVGLFLEPDQSEPTRSALAAQVSKDGSFIVKNVPVGNYHVVVNANSNNLRDYIVKEINVSGKDVGDSGFATGPGVSVLDIVASANGGAIAGTVVDGDNKTVSDVQVVCIPDESRRKRHDVYQQERTDQSGQFSLRGLNPGEYTVFALRDDADDITDPDFIQQQEAMGQKVRLDEGEHKTVVLKFSWNGEP